MSPVFLQGAVMHPAYRAGFAHVVWDMGISSSRWKLKVEIKSAPGINLLLLMASHTGAVLGPRGRQLPPSCPHVFTVSRYTSRFKMALMSTKYGRPLGIS